MASPYLESLFDLGFICRSIVDARHPCLVPSMVQHGFNDVRLNAEYTHARCDRPANIVNSPLGDRATKCFRNAGAERQRLIAPGPKRPSPAAENQIATWPPRDSP